MTAPWRRVPVPGRTVGWAARPIVRGATIALGCSVARTVGRVPVVAVHDIDGSPAFTLTHEATGRDVETSEPAIDEHGVIRAAVYEHDVELAIVAAHRDGTLLPRTSLGARSPLRAGDAGPKLGTAIAACAGGFLVSWEYRQVRAYFTGKFHDG